LALLVWVARRSRIASLKAWDLLFYLAIPISLMIGLAIINKLGGSSMAQFCDHLAIFGVVGRRYRVFCAFLTQRGPDPTRSGRGKAMMSYGVPRRD